MTAAITFDLTAVQDAQARLDEGIEQPGDQALSNVFEAFCQQEWHRRTEALEAAEYAAWLTMQCPTCGPDGSSGEQHEACWAEAQP